MSDDADAALTIIGECLGDRVDYAIRVFPSGQRVWTWTVLDRYVVRRAYIDVLQGETSYRIADFSRHPLFAP